MINFSIKWPESSIWSTSAGSLHFQAQKLLINRLFTSTWFPIISKKKKKKKKQLGRVFSPDPTPFPGTGELCSNHFSQNIPFVIYSISNVFPFIMMLLLLIPLCCKRRGGGRGDKNTRKKHTFYFVSTAICDRIKNFQLSSLFKESGNVMKNKFCEHPPWPQEMAHCVCSYYTVGRQGGCRSKISFFIKCKPSLNWQPLTC